MMSMHILEEISGSNDQPIIKRKRSKRLRPSSSTSSTSCYGGSGSEFISLNSLVSSSPASSSTCTEEDEDMANCLILLARGGVGLSPPAGSKFTSRKLTETTDNGKVGVYECKTCGRSFPSFQALGGHRASHKKPKLPPALVTGEFDQKQSPPSASPPLLPPQSPRDDQQQPQQRIKEKFAKINTIAPPISTQLLENKSKIHECSLCGSEFASGQALGGHMRRHRSVIAAAKNDSQSPDVGEKTGNILALDLNLPAPLEDDRRDVESDQFSSNQQPHLVFSAAALVDCHY